MGYHWKWARGGPLQAALFLADSLQAAWSREGGSCQHGRAGGHVPCRATKGKSPPCTATGSTWPQQQVRGGTGGEAGLQGAAGSRAAAGALAQLGGRTQGRGTAHLDRAAGQPAFCCRARLRRQPQPRSSASIPPACACRRCGREGQAASAPSPVASPRRGPQQPLPHTAHAGHWSQPAPPRLGSFTSDLQLGLALFGAVLVDSLAGVEAGVSTLRRQDVQREEPPCPLRLLRVVPAAVLHRLPVPQPVQDTGRLAWSHLAPHAQPGCPQKPPSPPPPTLCGARAPSWPSTNGEVTVPVPSFPAQL